VRFATLQPIWRSWAIAAYRHLNPEFDRFVVEAIADSKSVGQKIRFSRVRARIQTARAREEANDYHGILALFPANFPGRDDAAHDLFVAVFEGSLKREDVRARVKHCIAAHNRMFPTKNAKFAGRPLVSLDAQLFCEGTMTLGDTISHGALGLTFPRRGIASLKFSGLPMDAAPVWLRLR